MAIRVELFGIPRQRAGVAVVEVEAVTLGQALREAVRLRPALAECCAADGRLRAGYIANLDGRAFIHDPQTSLPEGSNVLLLSSDAGG
jgi:molybdopterin converting factor small subunit